MKDPDDFGAGFSEDGLANLRFGMAEISGEVYEHFDLYLAPEKLKVDYKRKVKGAAGSVLGSENVFKRVRDKMVFHQRDTVVFVHGYNVSFAEALASAARLKHNFSTANNGPAICSVEGMAFIVLDHIARSSENQLAGSV